MVQRMMTLPPIRFAADAVLGLAVFSGLTVGLLGPSAAAGLVATGISANMLTAMPPGFDGISDHRMIFMALAAAFSALFALNLAFIRHLRQAYVPSPGTKARMRARR